MSRALQRAWLARGPLAWLLLPFSVLYGALATLHRSLYTMGIKPVERLPVPVIVVGNVLAGGTGKTPVVLAVVEHLRQQGLDPCIVSRGYGRQGVDCREVRPEDPPTVSGDEPLLLRRKSGVPVFVASRRAIAGRALLQAYPQTRVIVSDDGLQHHAIARDLAICVFDERGTGNGWLLPAGPLRESWPRPVDLVLRQQGTPGIEGHVMHRYLAPEAVRADGSRRPLTDFREGVLALAGIANPEGFFTMLRAAGLQLASALPLPDHHDFADARMLPLEATLVCTEKDAAKLWRVRPDAWAVALRVELPSSFWREFDRLLQARLSSPHGSPPA